MSEVINYFIINSVHITYLKNNSYVAILFITYRKYRLYAQYNQ